MCNQPRLSGRAARLALLAASVMLTLAAPLAAAPATQSSTIALSADNTRLVSVNPEANSISIFDPAVNSPTKLAEIVVGTEPMSVAIAGNKAYVANAASNSLSIVDLAAQKVIKSLAVGAEPLGVAASPNGSRIYVACAAANRLTVVQTSNDAILANIDLSALGTSPRAVAVTNDGDADDTDETIFVALFFAQLRPGKTSVDEGQDDQRQGHIAAISAATSTLLGAPNPTVVGPIASTGFNANGRLAPASGTTPSVASTNPQSFTTPTGAFPNQLAAIGVHPTTGLAYVVSTGASPNGPLRFNHMAQGLVSVINMATRTEVTSGQTGAGVRQTAPLNLGQGVNLATTPAPRLFLTNPVALAWRPDGSDAWVVIQNSNVVVRLTVDAGGIPTVGAPLVAGPSQIVRVDLESSVVKGTAPSGIVINAAGTRAFVSNLTSRSITAINITTPTAPAILGTSLATALPPAGSLDATALLGGQLFFSGRGPQERLSSESWGGCIVCHPNGRSDNVTWMFDAGPRQTIALDGTFNRKNPLDQRILNWSAVRDENHDFELNTRGVFGGRGLIDDDRLFLAVGGTSGVTPTDSGLIEQFHQFTGAVGKTNDLTAGQTLPNLLGSRRDFGMATAGDGRIFIIGGRAGAGAGTLVSGPNTVLEFNPRTNVLTRRSAAGLTPRHSLGAAAVRTSGGIRIYAIGGYASTSTAASPVSTVQEYNPATDTWRAVASLPSAVAQFGITIAGGVNTADPIQLIHVVAGNSGSEITPVLVASTHSVQRFQADPVGPGLWSNSAVTGLTMRRNHGAAAVLRGAAYRIFVIGGQDAGGTVLETVDEYTNATVPVMTAHTSLPAPRHSFGIGSSLTTNQIYVFGGVNNTGADQTSVFEYTISSNGPVAGPPGTPSGTWVTRGNLSAARRGLQVSTPPGVTNFLPVKNAGRDARQDAIAVWLARRVRAARAPVPANDLGAMIGRGLFGKTGLVVPGFSCATCHGGPKWTRSAVDYAAPPSPADNVGLGNENVIGAELRKTSTQPGVRPGVLLNVGTFTLAGGRVNEIRFSAADISQAINPLGANGFNIPSLLSVHETAPYFYSGLAQTLEEVLNGAQDGNGGVRHHFVTSASNRANLIRFLRSIDDRTPIFP